jgi:hypothetical protein
MIAEVDFTVQCAMQPLHAASAVLARTQPSYLNIPGKKRAKFERSIESDNLCAWCEA